MISIDQKRARHAYAAVQAGKQRDWRADLRTAILDLPVRVYSSGLVQTLVFLQARAKSGDANSRESALRYLMCSFAHWMLNRSEKAAEASAEEVMGFIRHMVEADFTSLTLQTEEALAYLAWLKRFAEAELAKRDAGDNS